LVAAVQCTFFAWHGLGHGHKHSDATGGILGIAFVLLQLPFTVQSVFVVGATATTAAATTVAHTTAILPRHSDAGRQQR